MHQRILDEGIEEYKRIKQLAEVDKNFQPYLKWFHGEETKLSDHEKEIQQIFSKMHNATRPRMKYEEIAELAGCSGSMVSIVMNGHNQLSKEKADFILDNLKRNGVI